jgi:hypothetical protein
MKCRYYPYSVFFLPDLKSPFFRSLSILATFAFYLVSTFFCHLMQKECACKTGYNILILDITLLPWLEARFNNIVN